MQKKCLYTSAGVYYETDFFNIIIPNLCFERILENMKTPISA